MKRLSVSSFKPYSQASIGALLLFSLIHAPLIAALPTIFHVLAIPLAIIESSLVGFYLYSRARRFHKQPKWVRNAAFLTLFPFELFTLISDLPLAMRFFFALAHLGIFPFFVKDVKKHFKSRLTLAPVRLSLIAVSAMILIHWLACGWLTIYPGTEDAFTAYNKASYWVVTTLTTIGYGDITPTTNFGRSYTMIVMVMGAGLYGLVIANISRLLTESDRRKLTNQNKVENLSSFFKHYEVPKGLQEQVFSYYHGVLDAKANAEELSVIAELPATLQAELHTYMNLRPISRVSLFKGCSNDCLRSAVKKLEQKFVGPAESLILKGTIGHEMYLIGHGTVMVHAGEHIIAQLESGQCFGEMALIVDEPRGADVTTTTYCDLFVLTKVHFHELMDEFPELRANAETMVAERQKAKKPVAKAS